MIRQAHDPTAHDLTAMHALWEFLNLTSQPDMGPRGSPVALNSQGTGPCLVMERGLVESRNAALSSQGTQPWLVKERGRV